MNGGRIVGGVGVGHAGGIFVKRNITTVCGQWLYERAEPGAQQKAGY